MANTKKYFTEAERHAAELEYGRKAREKSKAEKERLKVEDPEEYARQMEEAKVKRKAQREAKDEKLKAENPEEYERRKEAKKASNRASSKKYYSTPEHKQQHSISSKICYEREMADPQKAEERRIRGTENHARYRLRHKDDPEYHARVNANHKAWRDRMLADPETAAILHEREKGYREAYRKIGKVNYTTDYMNVENYDEAAKAEFDSDKFVCHHKLENYYRQETLIEMGMYRGIPASQLVWVDSEEHCTDRSISVSSPLDSEWHKSIFEVIREVLELADRDKLPEEFDDLVTEVENDEDGALTEENFTKDEISSIMDVYWKMQKFVSQYMHYYTAMRLVEIGKKKLW